MAVLRSHGIEAPVPGGWEGDIGVRAPVAAGTVAAAGEDGGHVGPVLHLANFPLPAGRGDFGGGALGRMRSGSVFISLCEMGPESLGTPLFAAEGLPRFTAADFDPEQLQQTLPGQLGLQRFFHVGRRSFVLFVVLGSTYRAAGAADAADRAVQAIRIEP